MLKSLRWASPIAAKFAQSMQGSGVTRAFFLSLPSSWSSREVEAKSAGETLLDTQNDQRQRMQRQKRFHGMKEEDVCKAVIQNAIYENAVIAVRGERMTTNNKGKNGIKLDKEIKDNEKQEEEEKKEEGKMVMRLAKRLACAGYASRRQAEVLIRGGHVRVNGRFVEEVGTNVHATKDVVSVDGVVIPAMEKTRVYIAHKLKGELVTTSDPMGRATIVERFRKMGLPNNLKAVGRLDFNTEGLMVFTNDGDLSRSMELPKNELSRVYRALVRGDTSGTWKFEKLRRGVTIDKIRYRPIFAKVEKTIGKDTWLQITVTEGKNREVRKALEHVRLIVKELIRTRFGPYKLADLPKGAVLEVSPSKLLNDLSSR